MICTIVCCKKDKNGGEESSQEPNQPINGDGNPIPQENNGRTGEGTRIISKVEVDQENIEKPSMVLIDMRRIFAFPVRKERDGTYLNFS